ncbi:phosphatidate cytidylyltransferase, mitochondrial isoform X2 [Eurytemora carolleeae]|uniref:phosphatidate cytidylyltransferase, mitochondrial isoform X2 n=1 Tax=Eurytemora carolleeae TaxID=1294199 RepID=UPI000C76CF82|nr:phosphatidate cytidylyltransferase, mitochondrial isoform X2 [Eurytemora carolleeae]|eukprot:XP_023340058.1 phosphatidate cytidylyltransferase, mitochondrial-like isoform X2 [Eurytemora affinis]
MLGKLKLIVEPTFCRNCQISLLNLTFRRPQILEQNSNFNSGSQRQYTAIPLNHKYAVSSFRLCPPNFKYSNICQPTSALFSSLTSSSPFSASFSSPTAYSPSSASFSSTTASSPSSASFSSSTASSPSPASFSSSTASSPSLISFSSQTTSSHPSEDPVNQRDYEYFHRVLSSLPSDRSIAFAYGSGVFKQAGKAWTRNSMSDFIIATDNPEAWHKKNLQLNPDHYPFLIRLIGSEKIAQIQTDFGAKIYFNTLIPFEDSLIKYGVIFTEDLVQDLTDWTTLYVSGRLHKPVNILEADLSNEKLKSALRVNLDFALHAALLQLPARCTEIELYLQLAAISYTGDLRMLVGEDKNKVFNIVDAQTDLFRDLYAARLKGLANHVLIQNGSVIQDNSEESRRYHLEKLPTNLKTRVLKEFCKDNAMDGAMALLEGARNLDLTNKALR